MGALIGVGIFMAGGIIGAVIAALAASAKVGDMMGEIDRLRSKAMRDAIVRARVRAFQDHGIRQPNGEFKYNLQNAKGRFVSVFLPEV